MTGYTNIAKSCRTAPIYLLGAAIAASAIVGCSSSPSSSGTGFASDDAGTKTTTPDASTTSKVPDAGKDSSTVTVTPDASQGGGDDAGAGAPLALPFYVSDQFIPSGFMNDPTGITITTGANGSPACPTRAPSAGGLCYVVAWDTTTNAAWAGVYWQYPANNWGTEPGLSIAAGATQVSFYAQGAAGGEVLTFKSGGINDPLVAATGSYGDNYEVSSPSVTLTTTWTQYTISLQGATYPDGVLGAFVWVATATNGTNNNIKFYIDDLKWQ
jgi:hypothetical protein